MPRVDKRKNNELRKVTITKNYIKHPAGSCLICFGDTKVICTASVEEDVPPFLRGKEQGWVTAEYGMLPGCSGQRIRRDKTAGRTVEIQRLIGRSLRAVVDMKKLGERTIKIDCDVIQADGGTRTASITGGYVAMALAVKKLMKEKLLTETPLIDSVAAISVGICNGKPLLDLCYVEDVAAETDMNVVMIGKGDFVEVQGTAEGVPFSRKEMDALLKVAEKGIKELSILQKKVIGK